MRGRRGFFPAADGQLVHLQEILMIDPLGEGYVRVILEGLIVRHVASIHRGMQFHEFIAAGPNFAEDYGSLLKDADSRHVEFEG
jgi:hypothetical protein